MLHIASLVHDDIIGFLGLIDNSNLRRGMQSHFIKLGYKGSVYAGNYLIAVAYLKIYKRKEDILI